jgi:uncharacterized membrane protein
MTDSVLSVLTFCAALGCALIAGVFFAYSSFVMTALAKLPPAQGVAAMQSINVFAITPLFMTALFGTAAECVLLIVLTVMTPRGGAGYVLAGAVSYLVGTIVVTIACNVPRNNALAAVRPDSAEATSIWADYVVTWTAWNHVRTVASLIAAALLILSLGVF